MTLSRIQLIEDMIRENPEYTIRDYLDVVAEIENIKTEDMGSRKGVPNLTDDKMGQIVQLAKERKSVVEICAILGISQNCVYKACSRKGPGYKALSCPQVIQPEPVIKEPEKKLEKWRRPPAEYSNHSPFGIAS